jgi:excisionase family DNA binding protein
MTHRALPHPATRLLDEAGPTVSLAEAAMVLGISYNTASAAARRGELGVRALRYGRRWRIPTADLRRVLGIENGVV